MGPETQDTVTLGHCVSVTGIWDTRISGFGTQGHGDRGCWGYRDPGHGGTKTRGLQGQKDTGAIGTLGVRDIRTQDTARWDPGPRDTGIRDTGMLGHRVSGISRPGT